MDNTQIVERSALAALVDPSAALAAARRLEQCSGRTQRHHLFTREQPRPITAGARDERDEDGWLDA